MGIPVSVKSVINMLVIGKLIGSEVFVLGLTTKNSEFTV